MASHELTSLLGGLLGESLDVLIPGHHSVMTFGTEDPRVSAVHAACLATLEDELVRRASFVGVGSYFLFWKIKRHDRGLRLVRCLKFVEMRSGKYIPSNLVNFSDHDVLPTETYQPAV
jgi:hypothetical protein